MLTCVIVTGLGAAERRSPCWRPRSRTPSKQLLRMLRRRCDPCSACSTWLPHMQGPALCPACKQCNIHKSAGTFMHHHTLCDATHEIVSCCVVLHMRLLLCRLPWTMRWQRPKRASRAGATMTTMRAWQQARLARLAAALSEGCAQRGLHAQAACIVIHSRVTSKVLASHRTTECNVESDACAQAVSRSPWTCWRRTACPTCARRGGAEGSCLGSSSQLCQAGQRTPEAATLRPKQHQSASLAVHLMCVQRGSARGQLPSSFVQWQQAGTSAARMPKSSSSS